MKKILIFAKAVVFSAVFMFLSGCDRQSATEVSFDNEGFNAALNDVYSNFGSLTRASGPEDTDAYIEDVEMLMNWLQDIADEYGVKEIVDNSAYYKDLDMSDISRLTELSDEECLDFIKANGTSEYVRLFTEPEAIISQCDIESILTNNNLLPNEKIAFTTCFALLGDKQSDIFTRSGNCDSQYYMDALLCDQMFQLKGGLLGASVIISPGSAPIAIIMLIDVFQAYLECMDTAKTTYNDCKAKDTSPL